MRHAVLTLLVGLFVASGARAQTDVTVGSEVISNGNMIVSNLPAPDGDGAFLYQEAWPFAELTARYDGDQLTLGPTPIDDPDPYWYVGGGGPGSAGNKIMLAQSYAEITDGSLAGQTITFRFEVLSNTLTEAHTVRAVVRDFTSGSSVVAGVTIDDPGPYEVQLETIDDPTRTLRFGFEVRGVNVWPTDVESFGTVVIGPRDAVAIEASSFGAVKRLFAD